MRVNGMCNSSNILISAKSQFCYTWIHIRKIRFIALMSYISYVAGEANFFEILTHLGTTTVRPV